MDQMEDKLIKTQGSNLGEIFRKSLLTGGVIENLVSGKAWWCLLNHVAELNYYWYQGWSLCGSIIKSLPKECDRNSILNLCMIVHRCLYILNFDIPLLSYNEMFPSLYALPFDICNCDW